MFFVIITLMFYLFLLWILRWLKPLEKLIGRINQQYSEFFKRMGCAGQVSLYKDPVSRQNYMCCMQEGICQDCYGPKAWEHHEKLQEGKGNILIRKKRRWRMKIYFQGNHSFQNKIKNCNFCMAIDQAKLHLHKPYLISFNFHALQLLLLLILLLLRPLLLQLFSLGGL